MIRQRSAATTARLAGFAAAILSLVAAGAARGQVLQQVPSNSLVVLKVSNLKVVSDKVAKFSNALGLDAVSPELADPLKSLQDNLGIKQGLDTAGEAALVFTRPLNDDADPDDSILVLVPVADYKAFIANFEGAKTDGAVTTFKPGDDAEKHVANWGKYAAIVENKALLTQKPTGLKLSGLAAKEAKEKDAFLFANIPSLAEMALPKIAEAREEALAGIDRELGNDENAKQFAGVAKTAFGQLLTLVEGFLKDATAASLSVHLTDEGVGATMMAEFKPQSYAGKMAAQLKNTDQPLLAGLPSRKYFAVAGIINEPEVSSKVIGDLLDPIAKELAATEAGKSFAEAITSVKKGAGATKSVTFGYPMPTGAIGADSIVQSVMVARGDAKAIADSQRKTLAAMGEMFKLIPKQEGAPEMSFELQPGAKTAGDVKLDTYAFNMAIDENNPQAAQMQQMMAFIYGPGGMGGTFGVVKPDTFIMVQGGTDKLLNEAVKAAQNPKDDLSGQAQVKSVTAQLPAKRLAVEYIFVDNMINAGVKYAQGFGMPVKMQLPPNLPPIGATLASEGSALRGDLFLPTQLVQSVVAAGMQAAMQMQQGGAGGADGL